jgi:hypothetical protein
LKAITYADKTQNFQTLDVMFECPNPFFRLEENLITRLAYSNGTMTWPLITPSFLGLNTYQVTIDNDGDAPSPVEIYLDGGAIEPKITNKATGEFIKVEQFVSADERLYINTTPGRQEVSIIASDGTKTNAYSYLSDDSDLFRLSIGLNTITYITTDLSHNARLFFYYNKYFAGV